METFHTRVRGTDEDRARLFLAAARRRVRVADLVREALDSVITAEAQAESDSFFDEALAGEQVTIRETSDE